MSDCKQVSENEAALDAVRKVKRYDLLGAYEINGVCYWLDIEKALTLADGGDV